MTNTVLRFLIAALLVPALAGQPGPGCDAGIVAALRTAILSLSAVLVAWLSRLPRFRQAAWLIYPLLLLGAVKIAIEDTLRGRAATLFAALALYGAALLVASRMSRGLRPAAQERDGT